MPLLPAVIAFVLLCLLLVSSERMLADALRQQANAQVEQSSRLFAELLARRTAERPAPPGPTGAAPLRGLTPADIDALRQQILGAESERRQRDLRVVDAEGRVLFGTQHPIGEREWRILRALPESTSHTVDTGTGAPYIFSRVSLPNEEGAAPTAWHAVGLQPLNAALTSLVPFRRNLLLWGGGITFLLIVAGFAMSQHVARYQREHRRRLKEQGELLSAAIDSAGDAIVSVDLAGRIQRFNPAAARIFGHPASHMLGRPLSTLLPQAPHLDGLHRTSPLQGPKGLGLVAGVRADGQALELEASVSHFTVRGSRVATAILRDVTERVRTERALAQHQRALSELAQRLLQQEKQTTRKLAQTLHDQLGQTVSAMRLSFDVLLNLVPEPLPPKLSDRARILGQLIDTANAQVRQALVALRPPLLDDEGLQAALRHEVQARAVDAEPVELRLEVALDVAQVRWPLDVEHAAFMVAREAMVNALLHARASRVLLRIDGHAGQLHLSVTDDGIGLHPDMAAGRPGHLGIVGMRERALAIGAHLQAHGQPAGGSTVSLTWELVQETPFRSQTQDIDCAILPNHD
ncbi:sensor histidine kinase [Hydrogenophaga sp. BPS33]|uniref:sensor histidine kinase n=1 Tax=Hydrogenophaga sp. BPS33 TaxID=2651974 RepID=UPI001357186A|nr:PAS domain S-box protein [Hydrogenophaga sp. BPS33]